jgi:hypothetical protein
LCEGFETHRSDHQREVFLVIGLLCDENFTIQRACQIRERRQHAPRIHETVRGGEKKLAEFEKREQSAATFTRVQHGHDADAAFIHQTERVGSGRIRRDAHDAGLHHIANLGRDIRNEFRRGHTKTKSIRSFVSPQRAATASGMPVRRLNSA